jgi:ABC-type bacteriocin/lantibiotic exporter with double-glycine peptidase domain
MQLRNEDRSLEDQTLGDLFGKLASDTSNLVRQEVTLAKVELTQSARKTGRNLANLVVGGAIAYAALLAIVASAIMLLDRVLPAWSAALLVGLLIAGIAWLLVSKALAALRDTDITPRNTVETLKEDAAWMKEQIK